MASNAKIGLLLGLVVIFVIVFVINGLSGFGNARDGDDLPPIVVIDPTGIKPDIMSKAFPPRRVPERHPEEIPPPENKEHFRSQPPGTTSPDEIDNNTETLKQVWPKIHVVCKGDNLADIAKKFYGPKEGNRRANIKRIFEANIKALESPDKIYPGQELIIPPLWASSSDKNSLESIFPDSMFEVVDSIGRRHL
jgi:LysM repeat protein